MPGWRLFLLPRAIFFLRSWHYYLLDFVVVFFCFCARLPLSNVVDRCHSRWYTAEIKNYRSKWTLEMIFVLFFSINLRRERFIIDCAVCPLPTMQTTFRILKKKKHTNSKYLLLVGCCCCCYFLVYDFPCWSLSWSFSWWSNDWNCE